MSRFPDMKSGERNKPCHCGSGKKRKKCHVESPAELAELHDEALLEDFYHHSDEGRVLLANMRASGRRRVGMLVGIAEMASRHE